MDKFVIFDFDGVIVGSFKMAYDINKKFVPGLTVADYREMFTSNVHPEVRKVNGHNIPEGRFFKEYIPRLRREGKLVPGIEKIIQELSKKYKLIIVSSTPTSVIEAYLESNGVKNYFTDILGNDISHSKVEKFKMIFGKYKILGKDCIFITDTLGDIFEANEAGMPVIGAAWGFHGEEMLEKGRPCAILENPKDLVEKVQNCLENA